MFGVNSKPLLPTPGERPGARSREVPGTCTVAYGMIAKNPGDNWKSWNMLVEQRRRDEDQRAKDEVMKQEKILRVRDEFQKVTDKKRIMNMIQHRVECGLELVNRDMARRKEKLRELFLEEQAVYAQEIADITENEKQRKAEEAKRRAEEIQNQIAMEEKKIVEEKRMQQYMEKSEQMRKWLIKRNRMEIKWAQELQMKDQERMRTQEREIEQMWEAMARADCEREIAKEIEKEQQRLQKEKEYYAMVLIQKREAECQSEEERRRVREEGTRMVLKMMEDLKKEEELERANKLEQMEKRRMELDEQVKKREELLNRMREEDKIAADVFQKYAEEIWQKEHGARAPAKEVLRREADMYLAYIEHLRREKIEQEKELERFIQEEMDKLDKQRIERQQKLQEAKRRLEEQVFRERAEQLQWKRDKEEEDKRRKAEECKLQKEVLEQNMRLQKEHEFKMQMMRKQYLKDLQDQVEYQKTLRERERREIEREWQAGQIDEESYTRLLKQLIEKKFGLKVHPFRHVIDSSSHVTAEEGPCSCPPEIELDPEAKIHR